MNATLVYKNAMTTIPNPEQVHIGISDMNYAANQYDASNGNKFGVKFSIPDYISTFSSIDLSIAH